MEWECIYARLVCDAEDAAAWQALARRVECWARAVFRGRGHQVTEDVVAETCASVALGLDSARGADTFAGFVYGHFLNARRRMLRVEFLSQRSESLDDMDLAADAVEDDQQPDAVVELRRALEFLPDRERRAIRLRYFSELPAVAIAAELGVTDGNARRIVFNGLRRLRRHFGVWATPAAAAA